MGRKPKGENKQITVCCTIPPLVLQLMDEQIKQGVVPNRSEFLRRSIKLGVFSLLKQVKEGKKK